MAGYSVDTLRQLAATGDEYYRSVLADHMLFGALTKSQIDSLQERRFDDAELNPRRWFRNHLRFVRTHRRSAHLPQVRATGPHRGGRGAVHTLRLELR